MTSRPSIGQITLVIRAGHAEGVPLAFPDAVSRSLEELGLHTQPRYVFFIVRCNVFHCKCNKVSHLCEYAARPGFAELDVFLGQHILLTLEQHFNPKI